MLTIHIHIVVCCLLASTAFGATVDKKDVSEDDVSYGVLFDAGGYSTTLKVYRVSPAESSNALPRLDVIYSKRFTPGVDRFDDEEGLREYLTRILDSAKQNVPESKQESTPIYLFATADTDAVGVLDMASDSTQIAFVPRNPFYAGKFQVTVRRRTFELYVHSYLQFGIDAINGLVADVVAEKNSYEDEMSNPCMLRVRGGYEVTMHGSSDPDSCKEILETILTPEEGIRCQPKPCAIGCVYQPEVDDIHFYATQGFTYAPSTLKVVGEDEVLDLEALEEAASEHCRRTEEESVEAGIEMSLGTKTCLMGLYISKLFTLSYGFPPDTNNIKVTSNIGDSSIDWGLGAMVIKLTGNTVSRR